MDSLYGLIGVTLLDMIELVLSADWSRSQSFE
jgi:hypothetical protein